jgi:plastocyanin
MNNKIIVGIVFIILVIGGWIFFVNKPTSNTSPVQTTQSVPQDPNSIVIENFSFNPTAITVKAGDAVTWTNQDSTVHTIKSDSFNSAPLNQGDTFKFIFTTKGSFAYVCGIHPSMTGTIIVE